MKAIVVENICKEYKLYKNNKDVFYEIFTGKNRSETFTALENVSFSVEKGTSYGIIGDNGSGKSTLLRIISNNTVQTEGSIENNGKVALLNVGAGISQHYTGIQNIYYKSALNGLDKETVDELVDDIIKFSELEEFIEQPARKYSSGMRAKLGFSIAIHNPFDILIVDEALAVGDASFRQKCMNKMNELQMQGKTIIFVSHSTEQVRSFCDKCCWLHKGEMIAKGKTDVVLELYKEFSNKNASLEVIKRIIDYDKGTYYAD